MTLSLFMFPTVHIQIFSYVNISLVLLWSCSPVWLLEKAAPCGLRRRFILIVWCIVANRVSGYMLGCVPSAHLWIHVVASALGHDHVYVSARVWVFVFNMPRAQCVWIARQTQIMECIGCVLAATCVCSGRKVGELPA